MGLVTSCTKDGKNITVQGRVYNPLTGEGISDCEIRLVKESLELPGGNKTVLTVYPDANGYFELNHTSISARYVGCFFDNEKYAEIGWVRDGQDTGVELEPVKRGKFTYLDCQALTYGELKINIYNVNCEGATDHIFLERNYRHYFNYHPYSHVDLFDCYGAEGIPTKVLMGYYDLKWTVTKPSTGTQVFTAEVFVPENGIGEYTINY